MAAVLKLLMEPQMLVVLAQLAGTAAFCLFAPLIGEAFVPISVRLAAAAVITGCAVYAGPDVKAEKPKSRKPEIRNAECGMRKADLSSQLSEEASEKRGSNEEKGIFQRRTQPRAAVPQGFSEHSEEKAETSKSRKAEIGQESQAENQKSKIKNQKSDSPTPFVSLFAGSIANGLLMALVLRTVWTVLGVGGHLAALTSGLGLAEALTPGSYVSQAGGDLAGGPVGLLIWVIGVGAFLACGADQMLWQIALSSGSAGPLTGGGSLSSWLTLATDLVTRAALAGAILVGPALVAWALAETTLGLAGRFYPLPDGWVMVLPLRTGVGLVLLAVTTGWMWRTAGPIWQRLLSQTHLAGGLSS